MKKQTIIILAIAFNVTFFFFFLFMTITEGAPGGEDIGMQIVFLLIFIMPIINLLAIFSHRKKESWLGLFFKRKMLEQKRKILDEKKKIEELQHDDK